MYNKDKEHSLEMLTEALKEIGFSESERKVEIFYIERGSWNNDDNNNDD